LRARTVRIPTINIGGRLSARKIKRPNLFLTSLWWGEGVMFWGFGRLVRLNTTWPGLDEIIITFFTNIYTDTDIQGVSKKTQPRNFLRNHFAILKHKRF
jgi:hypothetical protein